MELPQTANPLADPSPPSPSFEQDGDRSPDHEEDSDHSVSVYPPEIRRLGALLSDEKTGKPTVLYRCCQVVLGCCFVWFVTDGSTGDVRNWQLKSDTKLQQINWWCQGTGLALMFLPMECARRCCKQGGYLDRLGAGRTLVSRKDARSLKVWRYATSAASAIGVLKQLKDIIERWAQLAMGNPLFGGIADPTVDLPVGERLMLNLKWFVLPPLFIVLVPILASGYLYTLRLGSALARDAIQEVIKKAKETSPQKTEAWNRDVAHPALELEMTMRKLSDGWGRGLLGIGTALWLMSLANFCKTIDPLTYLQVAKYYQCKSGPQDVPWGPANANQFCHRDFALVQMLGYLCLPLLLTLDVSLTSNRCDKLMDQLNAVRIQYGEESEIRMQWLENSLKNLHREQGLGFTISGVVVDKTTLRNVAMTIAGGATTLVTALYALTEVPPVEGGSDVCALTAAQRAGIRGIMTGANASCSFNMTVAQVIN